MRASTKTTGSPNTQSPPTYPSPNSMEPSRSFPRRISVQKPVDRGGSQMITLFDKDAIQIITEKHLWAIKKHLIYRGKRMNRENLDHKNEARANLEIFTIDHWTALTATEFRSLFGSNQEP